MGQAIQLGCKFEKQKAVIRETVWWFFLIEATAEKQVLKTYRMVSKVNKP